MPKPALIFLSRVPSLFCTVCPLIRSLIFPPCAALSFAVCRALPPTLRSLFPSVCHALPSHTSESTCRVSGVSRHRVPLHLEGNLTAVCQASHGIVCRYILMRSRVCLYSLGNSQGSNPQAPQITFRGARKMVQKAHHARQKRAHPRVKIKRKPRENATIGVPSIADMPSSLELVYL